MAKYVGIFLAGLLVGALAGGGTVYLVGSPPNPFEPPSAAIPEQAAAHKLALTTTLRFGEAIDDRNLAAFRATTTEEFQQRFSLDAFERAFSGFIDQQINVLTVEGMDPVLTTLEGGPDSDSLRLAGYFPTQPSRLDFDYSYTRAGPRWQLSGIDVKVAPR